VRVIIYRNRGRAKLQGLETLALLKKAKLKGMLKTELIECHSESHRRRDEESLYYSMRFFGRSNELPQNDRVDFSINT